MKISKSSFCTSGGVEIDDIDIEHYEQEELRVKVKKIIESLNIDQLESVVDHIVDMYGEREDLGDCDTCGHYSSITKLTIGE
jgi:hypothetical protein